MSGHHKPNPTRPAREGETCTCGRPATVVWLLDDLGPVPWCGGLNDDHKPADCPPWCISGHDAPFDREHDGELYGVPLDAHPYQVRTSQTGGEWETERAALLVTLSQDRPGRAPHISLTGQSGIPDAVSYLTAYEADRLADILHELAATLRSKGAQS